MGTVKTEFQKDIEKKLKGEDAVEKALNIATQMKTGIEINLSAQKGAELDLQDKVNKAKTKVSDALMNFGEKVSERNVSVQRYIDAKYELEEAEAAFQEQQKVKKWLEEASEKVSK